MFTLIAAALAQTSGGQIPETSGQLFRPSIDAERTLWTDDAGRAPDGYFLARGVAHYVRDPVLYVDGDGDVTRIVGDLLQLSVLGGFTKGPVRLGVDVPVYLRSTGVLGGETGLGDVALDVKGTLLDRTERPLGLALSGRATLPTATVQTALGNRGFGWEIGAIADKEVGDVLIAANLGVKGVPRADLENFTWGNLLVARVGAGWALDDVKGLSADVAAHVNLTDPDRFASPVEVLGGGWYRVSDAVLRMGVGTGLTSGFGAPQVRALVSVSFEPPRFGDTDGDGLLDHVDACVDQPEDFDGVADDDGCPEPTSVIVQVRDADGKPVAGATHAVGDVKGQAGVEFLLPGGKYDLSVEAPGYKPVFGQELVVPDAERHTATVVVERIVLPGKLVVFAQDPDGKPVPNASWNLRGGANSFPATQPRELKAGTYDVRVSAEGYRPATQEIALAEGEEETLVVKLQPAKVAVTTERIDIKDSIYFETAKAAIKPESFELLNEVAQLIVDHPEITRIRIEGHTDSRGDAKYNLELSKLRAAAVREYLIGRGVAADRLESEGFGEGKPLQKGENEAAWSKNRRVDFFVVGRAD